MSKLDIEIAAYDAMRPGLERDHAGAFALVHGDVLVGVFGSESDAYRNGLERFASEPFLIRQIGERPHTMPIAAYTLLEAIARS